MLMSLSLIHCERQEDESFSSKVSKLGTSKLRATRSLGDMMEKVKNKIFGSRKQSATASQNIVNSQRQTWNTDPMTAVSINNNNNGDKHMYLVPIKLGSPTKLDI